MIVGIGTDVVKISRVSERLAKRILSKEELEVWELRRRNLEFVAGRFALKEAFFKALGTGIRRYSFKDLSFLADDFGRPQLHENEKLHNMKEKYGFEKVHSTLSHDGNVAIAFVILERRETM